MADETRVGFRAIAELLELAREYIMAYTDKKGVYRGDLGLNAK